MSETTYTSTDVAMMGLLKRVELADQIAAVADENTPLRRFADALRAHSQTALSHLESGSDTRTVGGEVGIVGLIAKKNDSISFIVLSDLAALMCGSRLPERGHHG